MKTLIDNFPLQLQEAVEIAEKAKIHAQPVSQVLITGLGGSGIGGTIAAELAVDESPCPINVSKGYFLPAYVNEKTLVIVSSYSGNTEETISAMKMAQEKKARILCITSGGWIAEEAKRNNYEIILIPGGNPPRSCLGYSLVQQLFVFHKNGILKNSPKKDILAAADFLIAEKNSIQQEAKRIAAFLNGKLPVLYITINNEGIAIRFRQQINENSKMLCWHHVIPEMNHNELVGWRTKNENLAVLFLRHADEFERNSKRIEINKNIISQYTSNITDVFSKGNSRIEKCLYLIHLTDWVSYYIAETNQTDATEVKVIDHLKNELSKF